MCWGKTKLAVVVSCVLHYIFFAFFLTVFNCQTESFSSKYSLQNARIQENYKCQCSLVNASVNSMQDFVLKLGHYVFWDALSICSCHSELILSFSYTTTKNTVHAHLSWSNCHTINVQKHCFAQRSSWGWYLGFV